MTLTKQHGAERLLKVLHSSFNFKTHYEDSKHKSEICRAAFQASSQCKFKHDCDFAHDIRELRPRVFDLANFKRQKCCNWATGCQYATRCLYLHDEKSHEIETGMILLHSQKERKFRIVRDQGDGTVCVFTLHSDGKPKDALGKSVINSLWSFAKGKYSAIKPPISGSKKMLKSQKTIKRETTICKICPDNSKKSSPLPKIVPTKLAPTNQIPAKPYVDNKITQPAKAPKVSPLVGYISTPSPPLDPSAVILPEPLHTFTSGRFPPPGFALSTNLPTNNQSVYLEPIQLPPSSHTTPHLSQVSTTVSMKPVNPSSTLDHKAPPYIPGKQWAPTNLMQNKQVLTYKTADKQTAPMAPQPMITSQNTGYRPYEFYTSSPSPPMAFTYSASPPFGPYAPQYGFASDPRFIAECNVMIPEQKCGKPVSSVGHSLLPPDLPPSGVLMPPALPHSPAGTPKKNWEEDQTDQKEESPLPAPRSTSRDGASNRDGNAAHSKVAGVAPGSGISPGGSTRLASPTRHACMSPTDRLRPKTLGSPLRMRLKTLSPSNMQSPPRLRQRIESPSSHADLEEHKTPDRPIKQGVFDPLLMEVDETKGLLKMIADYHKALGSQEEQIRKLENENARLRQEFARY